MPDGSSTHRIAASMRTALVGKVSVLTLVPETFKVVPGDVSVIEDVRSHGRHLEVVWDDGVVLHSNLRITGTWHLYRRDDEWKKSPDRARVVIESEDWIAVCFNAPVLETYRDDGWKRHPFAGRLGPDVSDSRADRSESVRRIMNYEDPESPIAEVILDERVMRGFGNVFRSEVLWRTEIHPRATVGSLAQSTVVELVDEIASIVQENMNSTNRSTTSQVAGNLAVYGRNGKHCSRCKGVIQVRRQGEDAKILYWCPDCQKRYVPRPRADDSDPIVRMIDSHPVASEFLRELAQTRPLTLDREERELPGVAEGSG